MLKREQIHLQVCPRFPSTGSKMYYFEEKRQTCHAFVSEFHGIMNCIFWRENVVRNFSDDGFINIIFWRENEDNMQLFERFQRDQEYNILKRE